MQKYLLLYIGISLCAAGCGPQRPELQTGDLLFQVGAHSPMAEAITEATTHNGPLDFTHVGIAIHHPAADSVLEASGRGGVRIVSLEEFLEASARIDGQPAVVAMRLRDTTGTASSVVRARSYLGQPYDYSYRPDNGKMYCSELVWESYRTSDGSRMFAARPMNFRAADGSMPDFWIELFEKSGEAIPQGIPGTNPNDLAREPSLYETGRWFR